MRVNTNSLDFVLKIRVLFSLRKMKQYNGSSQNDWEKKSKRECGLEEINTENLDNVY